MSKESHYREVMMTGRTWNTIAKAIGLVSVAALSFGALAACGNTTAVDSSKGRVYYLNKKAEEQEKWEALAQAFQDETGIETQIQLSATDYDQTLRSEMAKDEAPTMFQADGPSFMYIWLDYAADMSDSKIYGELTDSYKDRTLKNADGKPVGIPYAVESYGIIYNKSLLKKYFDASWSSVKSIDGLNNFKALKTVADEIQEHKDDMGVKGAFTSAGMDSSAFRYNFHLPSLPLFYEYRDDGVDMNSVPESVKGTYVDYMQNIYDLYITDATVPASSLSGKTMDDATSEFALGEAVFFQDGVWIYSALQDQGFPDEDLGVLPIYMGVDGEEKQGLNQVISNYWCVNSKSSQKDQEATQQFLEWLVTSDAARESISQDMGLVTPFKTFDEEAYTVKNPLVEANREYQENGYYDVISVSTVSHQWEKDLGSAELNYAQGQGDWDAVKKVFTDDWAKEYKLAFAK